MTKVAIIGSRMFLDYELMKSMVFSWVPAPSLIVSGGAKGADTLAAQLAYEHKIPLEVYKPDWNLHGAGAGFIRNYTIVNAADVVIAFWDGYSKGTEHSIKIATKAEKTLFVCRFADKEVEKNIATIEHMFDE